MGDSGPLNRKGAKSGALGVIRKLDKKEGGSVKKAIDQELAPFLLPRKTGEKSNQKSKADQRGEKNKREKKGEAGE